MRIIALSINSSWNIVNFRSGLVRRLLREGYRVVAIAPPDSFTPMLHELGVETIDISIDSKGLSPLRDMKLAMEYWRVLRALRPLAFLGWTIKPNVYGSLAAHALGIPVINNISGLGTAFIRGGLLTRVVTLLYRAALRRSATVFFQNGHDRDLFVTDDIVCRDRTEVLPGSGIDVDQFTPQQNPPGATCIFLLVARLLTDKGVVEFVDAARLVRGTRSDVEFRMLGFLDVENRTAISREQVEIWEREGVIRYLGASADVRPHLAAATVVVLPSYREGMPRSLLEAAAMAKPLIATDVPGCTEIARAGENALLCRPRDAASLADAMHAMLALDPADRARMGDRSREIAVREFDVSIIETRYLAAIDRVTVSVPG